MTVEPDVRARRQFFEQARELTPYVAAEYEGAVFVVPTDADDRFFVKQRREDVGRRSGAAARDWLGERFHSKCEMTNRRKLIRHFCFLSDNSCSCRS